MYGMGASTNDDSPHRRRNVSFIVANARSIFFNVKAFRSYIIIDYCTFINLACDLINYLNFDFQGTVLMDKSICH